MKLLGRAYVAAVAVYLAIFVKLQLPGIFDPHVMEWDARAFSLVAWRYHGTGLFRDDYLVDMAATYCTPLWKLAYWIGTLFTDPFTLSKLLPFLFLAVVVWHGFQLGRAFGGAVLGAATVLGLVHCTFLWNRMAGATPRGFGFPLVVMFLRYAATGCERRALATLLLQAIGYPSAFVISAPAMGALALWRRDRRAIIRFAVVAAVAAAILAKSAIFVDARFGRPVTLAQAAELQQLHEGGPEPFYPRHPPLPQLADTLTIALRDTGDFWHGPSHQSALAVLFFAIAVAVAGRRLRELPPILPLVFASAFGAFWLAYALAYRLYLPSRMVQYAWPPVILLALPIILHLAFSRRALAATTTLTIFLIGVGGDGLPRSENLTDFRQHDVPMLRFVATLPKDILVATHPERASYVQTFALRRALFSASLNMPHYDAFGRELERRIGDFYRAYYARDLAEVIDFARKYAVDYLILDERDFGPEAMVRADYYFPWGDLARSLVPGEHALAHPPPDSIVFRDGTRLLVDLKKLH